MDLTPVSAPGRQKIQKYGNGRFTVSGAVFNGSVLVLPDGAVAWPATDIAALSDEAVSALIEHARSVDICLIGCGANAVPFLPDLRKRLKEAGVHVDFMDTGAACRTFNVLVAEGRSLAAALIAI
ncbi:MAG: Mth938-like domain-containing protein [Rhodospirillaceae bacterium]|nr:Mth938-like domain-containing protein [Rhodospirillaceae bacterium]